MRIAKFGYSVISLFAASSLVTGCSSSFTPGLITVNQEASFGGSSYGGRQPIEGAAIYVYAASTAGYGAASTSLITSTTPSVAGYPVTEDANGNYYVPTDTSGLYKISSSLACTTGTQIYLYSIGGDAGSGVNSAAGLTAILGNCADGVVADILTADGVSRIDMSELSTVAAAYSYSGFAVDALHIGSSGTALAKTGIKNAFATSAQLYQLDGQYGGPPGGGEARATTPNGNGTVTQGILDSIANSLASCVNTNGASSPACTTLFTNAKSAGSTGTTATDTATAAINIAHNPTANVKNIYYLASNAGTNPYVPYVTSTPNDFTVNIVFTGGGLATSAYYNPHGVAVDASGYIWVVNSNANKLAEFTPLGVPVSSTGYTVGTLPISVAIDSSGNAWTANASSNNLSKVTSGGGVTNYAPGLSVPADAEFDASGNLWVANDGNSKIIEVSSAGTTLTTYTSTTYADGVYSVALEPGTAGDIWGVDSANKRISEFSHTTPPMELQSASGGGINGLYYRALTIDAGKNAWGAQVTGYLVEFTQSGTATLYTTVSPGAYYYPNFGGIIFDGANNFWATDSSNGVILEGNDTGTLLSGNLGFIAVGETVPSGSAPSGGIAPSGIAVDGSGNVWYNTSNDGTLRELVGAATPVITPISYAVTNSNYGTKP